MGRGEFVVPRMYKEKTHSTLVALLSAHMQSELINNYYTHKDCMGSLHTTRSGPMPLVLLMRMRTMQCAREDRSREKGTLPL